MARLVIGCLCISPPIHAPRVSLGIFLAVARPPLLVVRAEGGEVIRLLVATEADPGLLLLLVLVPPLLASTSLSLPPP